MSDDPFQIGGKEGGNEYEPVPGGIHLAGLAAIIHTPDVPGTEYGTGKPISQNLLRLIFVVPEQTDSKGAWKQILKLINMPDNPLHANSGVRKFLEQWLGRPLTDAEKQTFHLRMMIGARAQLVTQIAESEQKKRKYAKLTAISPPPADLPPWQYQGTVVRAPKHPGQTCLLAHGVRIEETESRQAPQQVQPAQPAQVVQPSARAQPAQPQPELTEDDIPF